jgi:pyrroloquinoline quinone biosynthesis protein B
MTRYILYILFFCLSQNAYAQNADAPYVLVLGTAQDGGYPHMGCQRECCSMVWKDPSMKRYVVSLALVDPKTKKWWLFEATPDIREQLHYFQQLTKSEYRFLPDGIFVTHAHIGHYTGLMELGKEVMGPKDVPVYALPRMKSFLESNGPWSQLVNMHNISIQPQQADSTTNLTSGISVHTFTVPHRDEYSETAGFEIITSGKKYLFIPDINSWDKWNRKIIDEVKAVDIAMLDATFFDANELPDKNMTTVPHPLVTQTMELFDKENKETKSKIHFIHFNHTNPLLWDSKKQKELRKAGFNISEQGEQL